MMKSRVSSALASIENAIIEAQYILEARGTDKLSKDMYLKDIEGLKEAQYILKILASDLQSKGSAQ